MRRPAIVGLLIAVMTWSPIAVWAQPPGANAAAATAAGAKLDVGYVTPGAGAAIVVHPRRVLTAPGMEMLPVEVITAAGIKELSIDPLQIEQLLLVAEMPSEPMSPPGAAVVVRLATPPAQTEVLPMLWKRTAEAKLDGKPYRQGQGPMDPSIFWADERTLIVGLDSAVRAVVANHASPKAGRMAQILSRVAEPPDAMAVVLVEPLRPMVVPLLSGLPVPPPLEGAKKIPELLNTIGIKVNLTGDQAMSLNLRANDAAAAEELEKIFDQLLSQAQQMAVAQAAKQETSSDPGEQAGAKYAKRMSQRLLKALRPVRNGAALTLATQGQGSMVSMGIVASLLLPAMQSAREAARRAQLRPGPPPAVPVR